MVDEDAFPAHVGSGFEGQVRANRPRPVTDQQGEMHHFPGLPGFHHQPHPGPGLVPQEMMVHRPRRQKTGNGNVIRIHAPVAQKQNGGSVFNRLGGLLTEPVQSFFQSAFPFRGGKQDGQFHRFDSRFVQVADFFHLFHGENGMGDLQLPAVFRRLGKQIQFFPQGDLHRHDQFLPNGVDGRVGHLSKKLFEIMEQELRFFR